jgi:lysophospholipase L1-like esterase
MEAVSPKLKPSVAAGLILAGLVCGLGVVEGSLRVAGFSSHVLPTLQFGWPVAKALVDQFQSDRDVFWVPNDYFERLAAARARPPATVFLGDSCTEWGEYPALTLQHLKGSAPTLATGIKLGVAGWSSVQGLTQLRRDVLPLNPRVVTIYFGWNDHWRALGPADSDARLTAVGWWLSQHARFYQLWMKVRLVAAPNDLARRPIRVPLALYEANLREMARLIREHGGTPVLITAPAGHEPGKEPRYLAQQNVAPLADLIPLHASYVEGTRHAAAASGAMLCDAAHAFETLPASKAQYFQKDGIHLSAQGDARLANIVASCIADSGGK